MKNFLQIMLLITVLFGCKSFETSLETGLNTAFNSIFPDSCDIVILDQIVEYRKIESSLPDSFTVMGFQSELSPYCKDGIRNIHSIRYGIDSLDIEIKKIFKDSTISSSGVTKEFRLIFEEDTLHDFRILHFPSRSKLN